MLGWNWSGNFGEDKKKFNEILLFRYYLNLEKGVAIKLNIIESPFIQRCLVPNLVENGHVILEKMKL